MTQKTVVITGASKGIGKALSMYFAKQDYSLLLIARSINLLSDLQIEIEQSFPTAEVNTRVLDITDNDAVKAAIDTYYKRMGHIDVLVNNAGHVKRGTSEIDDIHLNEMIDVNLKGLINVTRAVVPYMQQAKKGHIINMSSRNAKTPRSFLGIYAATKAGVLAYNESLYKELAEHGIKVTALVPGFVDTHMTSDVPLDRCELISPEEITKFVGLILSLSPATALKEICFEATPQIGGYA